MAIQKERNSKERGYDLNKIRAKAVEMEPIIRIGKKGITPEIIEEIGKHLKKRKLIKIKMLKSASDTNDRKEVAKEISDKTGSEVVQQIGQVIVLYRK